MKLSIYKRSLTITLFLLWTGNAYAIKGPVMRIFKVKEDSVQIYWRALPYAAFYKLYYTKSDAKDGLIMKYQRKFVDRKGNGLLRRRVYGLPNGKLISLFVIAYDVFGEYVAFIKAKTKIKTPQRTNSSTTLDSRKKLWRRQRKQNCFAQYSVISTKYL